MYFRITALENYSILLWLINNYSLTCFETQVSILLQMMCYIFTNENWVHGYSLYEGENSKK